MKKWTNPGEIPLFLWTGNAKAQEILNGETNEENSEPGLWHFWLLGQIHVCLGETQEAEKIFRSIEAWKCEAGIRDNAVKKLLLYAEKVMFSRKTGMDFRETEKEIPLYTDEEKLLLMCLRGRELCAGEEYEQALGMAEAGIMMTDGGTGLAGIYLNLTAAMAAIHLKKIERADAFFEKAFALAEDGETLQPFSEYHGSLMGMNERHFKWKNPELYEKVSGQAARYERFRRRQRNEVTDMNELTPYEDAAARLATKGWNNHEIADFFHISFNSAKLILSRVYQKTGTRGRRELIEYLG